MSDFQAYSTSHKVNGSDWNYLLNHGLIKSFSYIIDKSGTTYRAINGTTGNVLISSSNIVTVERAIVSAGGSSILLKDSATPYVLNLPFLFDDGIEIIGESKDGVTLQGNFGDGVGQNYMLEIGGHDHCKIKHVTIDANDLTRWIGSSNGATAGAGDLIACEDVEIEDVNFVNGASNGLCLKGKILSLNKLNFDKNVQCHIFIADSEDVYIDNVYGKDFGDTLLAIASTSNATKSKNVNIGKIVGEQVDPALVGVGIVADLESIEGLHFESITGIKTNIAVQFLNITNLDSVKLANGVNILAKEVKLGVAIQGDNTCTAKAQSINLGNIIIEGDALATAIGMSIYGATKIRANSVEIFNCNKAVDFYADGSVDNILDVRFMNVNFHDVNYNVYERHVGGGTARNIRFLAGYVEGQYYHDAVFTDVEFLLVETEPLRLTFYQPRTLLDDFYGAVLDAMWLLTVAGTGAGYMVDNQTNGRYRLHAPTTNDTATINWNNICSLLAPIEFESKIKLSNIANMLVNIQLVYSDTTNMIRFRYDTSVDTKWQCQCTKAGAATTTVDSGVVPDTNDHTFGIRWNVAEVKFYIDSVLVATIATNVPIVKLQPKIIVGALEAAIKDCDVDYVIIRQKT